jgi:hypothetical protein
MKPSLMQFVFLISCLFVLASPGMAQTNATLVASAREYSNAALPDAPTPASSSAATSEFAAERAPIAAEQVVDRKFLYQIAPLFGSSVINAELSLRCVKSGACTDVPSFLHSRAALYGVGIPADVGITLLEHSLKRSGHRWWLVPSTIVTAGNLVYAIHAARYMH